MCVGTLLRSRTLVRRPCIYIYYSLHAILHHSRYSLASLNPQLKHLFQNYFPFSIFEEKPLFSFPFCTCARMPGKYDGKSSLIHLGKFPPVENHGFQPVQEGAGVQIERSGAMICTYNMVLKLDIPVVFQLRMCSSCSVAVFIPDAECIPADGCISAAGVFQLQCVFQLYVCLY
jgi:hypothetical protein